MKALTLWQPYASAIALKLKQFETRSWKTNYRGPLAIHASIKPLSREYQKLAARFQFANLPKGEIVAIAELTDCLYMTQELINKISDTEKALGDWQIGRYAWQLDNIQIPQESIKLSGKQGLWTWQDNPFYTTNSSPPLQLNLFTNRSAQSTY